MAKPQQQQTEPNKGLLAKARESLKDPAHYGELAGEWRRGLKDAQQAFGTMQGTIGSTRDEAGTIANPTQQIVTSQLTGEDVKSDMGKEQGNMTLDDLRGYAKERAAEAGQQMDGPAKQQQRGGMER